MAATTSPKTKPTITPEQQEVLGGMELQRLRSRQQLLGRARHGMNAVAGLLTGLAGGLAILCTAFPRTLPIAIAGVVVLVTFHAARLHRRLDALMELLDDDIKRSTKKE